MATPGLDVSHGDEEKQIGIVEADKDDGDDDDGEDNEDDNENDENDDDDDDDMNERTVRRLPQNSQPPTPPPSAPAVIRDGGWRAWLQVAGAFIVFANFWGTAFAFGSFQSYYAREYIPGQSPSSIAGIGTVSIFLLVLLGVLSGPLFDLGWFRVMLLVGALGVTLSVFLTSISTTYATLMLSQGILPGLFNGLLYLPGVALVGRSFQRHRALALGITMCGGPVGGIIYTVIFQQLISRTSFAWTVQVMGFTMGLSYLVSFPLLLWGASNTGNLATGTPRKLFDRAALSDVSFWLFTAANFLIFCGYMVPFIFIPSYGQLVLGESQRFSLDISMLAQGTSILGRLVAGWSAAKCGVMIPWATCVFGSAIMAWAWVGARNTGGFIATAALYGFLSGAIIPLAPSIFPVICPDPRVLGTRLGMSQGMIAFASLIGPPIAAALADVSSGRPGETNYLGLQLFSGLTLCAGGCVIVGLWVVLIRRREGGSMLI